MLGFGTGSLGAHFNPVCFAITSGETAEAYGTVSLHVYVHFPTDISFLQAEGKAIKLGAADVALEPASVSSLSQQVCRDTLCYST